jgi:hypothetical protein
MAKIELRWRSCGIKAKDVVTDIEKEVKYHVQAVQTVNVGHEEQRLIFEYDQTGATTDIHLDAAFLAARSAFFWMQIYHNVNPSIYVNDVDILLHVIFTLNSRISYLEETIRKAINAIKVPWYKREKKTALEILGILERSLVNL